MKGMFAYQSQRLNQARSSLMLPHPRGEEQSIADALHSCSLAFNKLNMAQVPDLNATDWIQKIRDYMDTTGVTDQTSEGTFVHKARQMTQDERMEFSRIVNDLAHWFDHEYYGR